MLYPVSIGRIDQGLYVQPEPVARLRQWLAMRSGRPMGETLDEIDGRLRQEALRQAPATSRVKRLGQG